MSGVILFRLSLLGCHKSEPPAFNGGTIEISIEISQNKKESTNE